MAQVDWHAVLEAPAKHVQAAIQCRGFQFMLTKRIQVGFQEVMWVWVWVWV